MLSEGCLNPTRGKSELLMFYSYIAITLYWSYLCIIFFTKKQQNDVQKSYSYLIIVVYMH